MGMGRNIHLDASWVWAIPQRKATEMSKAIAEAEKNVEFIVKDEMMSIYCGSKTGWMAADIVCSTNQAFLSFPEPWRAFSMRFRWSGLRGGLWKTQSGATCQSSLQGRTFLASEGAVSSLQLSALSRHLLYCRSPISPRSTPFLGWMASKDGLIVGRLLRPSMFSLPALKSPLFPRAPKWGWPGVACWVCITVWFLPSPASTVLIPNQYSAC